MALFRYSIAAGALLAALAAPALAQPYHEETKEELFQREMDHALELQGLQPGAPAATASATWGQEERCFPFAFTRDPSISRASGKWTLVNEIVDGHKEFDSSGLKTGAGLERTLLISASGSPSEGFTSIPFGTNIDGTNVNDPREDHVGSWWQEFTIKDDYLKFMFKEDYPENAPFAPPFKTCLYGYWCRNYLLATHLICQVEKFCARRDGTPTGTSFICQDFKRAKEAAPPPERFTKVTAPEVRLPRDGELLPGFDAPPPPVPAR